MREHSCTPLVASVVLVAVALTLLSPPSPARADGGHPALEGLAGCVRDTGYLMVLLLIDESGSLKATDPDGQRVTAARTALQTLATLGSLSVVGTRPQVEVALAGFSTDFNTLADWTKLDDTSLPGLVEATAAFSDRDSGVDTDFASALIGARDALARRSAAISADASDGACKALLLFTDGAYSIEERTTDARRQAGLVKSYALDLPLDLPGNAARVMDRGRTLLCEREGLADQLRADGVVTITIALSTQIPPADQEFLERLATGASGDARCGTRGGVAAGAYLLAPDLSGLLVGFDRVASEIGGGLLASGGRPLPVCQAAACPEGRREFEVDRTLRAFHVLADLGAPGILLELRSPTGGGLLELHAGSQVAGRLGTAEITSTPLSEKALAVDAVLPAGTDDWAGTWSATFVDPTGRHPTAVANSQITLYGGLSPELRGTPELRIGEATTFEMRIVDSEGSPATIRDGEQVELEASIGRPGAEANQPLHLLGPSRQGVYQATYTPDDTLASSSVTLRLDLRVRTRAGTALPTMSRTFAIPVRPPASYPRLEPATLRLSSVTGKGTARGFLTVHGGSGGGCVWLEALPFTAYPREAGTLSLKLAPDARSQPSCLPVEAGQERTIEVLVSPKAIAAGTATGSLRAHLSTEIDNRVMTSEIPLSFDLARPVNEATRWTLLLVLLVMGLLLPPTTLWLAHRLQARFEPPNLLRATRIPIRVRADRIERGTPDDSGHSIQLALRLTADDFTTLSQPDRRVRRFEWGGLHFRTRVPFWPTRFPFGEATATGQHVVGSGGLLRHRGEAAGRLPLALADSWLFVLGEMTGRATDADERKRGVDREPVEVHGYLVAFHPLGPFDTHARRLVDVLERDLPAAARRLAGWVERQRPAAPPAPADTPRILQPVQKADNGGFKPNEPSFTVPDF
jgi:hypothetical protein